MSGVCDWSLVTTAPLPGLMVIQGGVSNVPGVLEDIKTILLLNVNRYNRLDIILL